jgi:hypothetical protein
MQIENVFMHRDLHRTHHQIAGPSHAALPGPPPSTTATTGDPPATVQPPASCIAFAATRRTIVSPENEKNNPWENN